MLCPTRKARRGRHDVGRGSNGSPPAALPSYVRLRRPARRASTVSDWSVTHSNRFVALTHAGNHLHDGEMEGAAESDVFRALADASRRHLLDELRMRDGRTLGELVAGLAMARQSVSQHLAVLESANLVSVVWQGRRKLHYLNPIPLQQIQDRWIDQFARPRVGALSRIKRQAEEALMT